MSTNGNAKTGSGRVAVIGPGIRHPVPIALDPAAWRASVAFGANDRPYASDGTRWRDLLFADEAVILTRQNIEVTVGAGGDYATLGEALDFFNSRVPSNAADQLQGTVKILAGTVLAEQVILRQSNLGWVKIVSEDETVPVQESSIVDQSTTGGVFPFMEFIGNAPVIGCYFESDQTRTGPQQTVGMLVRSGYCATTPVLSSDDTSSWPRCGFGKFSIGVSLRLGAAARFTDVAKFVNSRDCNVEFLQGWGSLAGGDYTGGGQYGVYVSEGSQIFIAGPISTLGSPANYRRNGASDQATDIFVNRQSVIRIGGGLFVLGGISSPPFRYTEDGYIADMRKTSINVVAGLIQPSSYTVATIPSAALYPGMLIHVSNGDGGNPCIAMSNGTSWLRLSMGAAVST